MTSPAAARAQPHAAGAESRWLRAAASAAPVALLFVLWWNGLRCWFIADDFAWLGLLPGVHDFQDFLHAMFAPMAQGTIRPWSERGFYLLFESLFGLDPLPFRLCVFFTAAIDAVLVSRLALRLTHSRFAAGLAPVLWIVNAALADALCWTCVYNELLCPLFLLGGLLLFIRWIDTGERRWWWWQLAVFTLGFGALELNVVYPALALALLVCGAGVFAGARTLPRARYLSLAPLFLISATYFLLHRAIAPMPKAGVYVLHFDLRIFSTLALYWKWTVMPQNWAAITLGTHRMSRHAAEAGIALVSAAFVAAVIAGLRRGDRAILFGPAWFLITLAPLLPLYDHRSYYYLTIPLIGFALSAAEGVRIVLKSSPAWRAAGAVALLAYLSVMIPACRIDARWWRERDVPIRSLVLGVRQARENHPSRTIVLDRVTDELYNDAIAHSAFWPFGVDHVYLTPDARLTIHPAGDPAVLDSLAMDPAALRRALLDDSVVIYSVSSGHLRNITVAYRRGVLGG